MQIMLVTLSLNVHIQVYLYLFRTLLLFGFWRDKSSRSIDEDIDGEEKVWFVYEYYAFTMGPQRVGSLVKSYVPHSIMDGLPMLIFMMSIEWCQLNFKIGKIQSTCYILYYYLCWALAFTTHGDRKIPDNMDDRWTDWRKLVSPNARIP
jgi:hypothetical protein